MEKGSPKDDCDAFEKHFLLAKLCNSASSAKSCSSLPKERKPKVMMSKTRHATSLLRRVSVPRTTVSGSSTLVVIRAGHSPPSHKRARTSRIANCTTPARARGQLREPRAARRKNTETSTCARRSSDQTPSMVRSKVHPQNQTPRDPVPRPCPKGCLCRPRLLPAVMEHDELCEFLDPETVSRPISVFSSTCQTAPS